MSESNPPPRDPDPFDPPPAAPPPPDPFNTAPPPPAESGSYDTAPPSTPAPPLDAGAYAKPAPPPQPLPYGGAMGYPGPYAGPPPDKDSKTMAMLAHLLSIFIGFLGPLIIWLLKKDTSPFVNDQGKESLNFQLVVLIGYVIGFATSFLCIGFLVLPLVWLFSVIFAIIGTIQSNNGVAYRYPVNIRFIK